MRYRIATHILASLNHEADVVAGIREWEYMDIICISPVRMDKFVAAQADDACDDVEQLMISYTHSTKGDNINSILGRLETGIHLANKHTTKIFCKIENV
jgi:hypothetical protein